MRFAARPSLIGIDVGGGSLAAVQLAPPRRGVEREVEASVEIPRSGPDVPIAADLGRLVRVMARRGFRQAPVVVGLPDDDVTIAELSLPSSATGAPLGEIVAAQLARICQADPATLECAWWATDVPGATSRRSLAAAVPLAVADPIAQAFEEAGLEVAAMEARPLALARACKPILTPSLEVLVDRSAALPSMVVLERGEVSYVRPFTPPAVRPGQDAHAPLMNIEAFLAELRLTLGYLSHRHPSESITRILLAGREHDLVPIAEMLTYTWDLPAELLRLEGLAAVPERLNAQPATTGCGLVVALGLALRGRQG
jgi:Tfp pilus assembly PilM family ATPase